MKFREHLKYSFFDLLINKNISFVLYRLPGEHDVRLVLQTTDQSETFLSLSDLNNKKGFVIAPFQISKTAPIVLIQPDIVLTGEESIFNYLYKSSFTNNVNKQPAVFFEESKATRFDHYQKGYAKFHDILIEESLKKLVLSRTFEIVRDENFSAGLSFERACEKYPDNFIFLCNNAQSGAWLGCSPEVLVSGQNGNWKTDALAGTKKTSKDDEVIWDNKNRLEQQIVIEYMQEQLLKAGIESTYSEPKTIRSGNLAHLKSEFTFQIDDSSKIGNLLNLLHPSPAVCGFPKKEAFDFIIENEGYDRKYYSGFLGYLDVDNKTDLFVNLRCMQIFKQNLRLFAGGGILPSSELISEWKETEYKLQTILSIINE
ncbi:isochorismate synthase [Dysgonomonas sp. HGC4]|uniref:isochorismate synthase n=1 Tax=Dysgonomonas sp. HGC4 TaxID=1658009 RepID=UPI000680133F|nr:isochorismate synthase [Dysgonomonas sp. HGC4]MBD8348908.1 isochorismate synthase [Dysgonomonas sp. HGC4]